MAVHADIMEKDTGIDKDGGGKLSYADAVEERSKIETKIGLSLAKNAELTKIAAKITEKAKVKSYGELDEAGKKKTDGQVGAFGGAAAFKEGWGTLGSSVSAVMTEIEKDPATKAKYSVSHTKDHPYFPKDQKKPEFDKPIAECSWEELPQDIRAHLNTKAQPPAQAQPSAQAQPTFAYDTVGVDTKRALLKDYRYKNSSIDNEAIDFIKGNISRDIIDKVKAIIGSPVDDTKREEAKAAIIQEMAKSVDESLKAQLGALLDIVVDRHTSGDHTNIVRMNNDGGAKDQWIKDTVKAGKPIISGPSGHTLRYLNFWAEKRNENIVNAQNHNEWPSLEAARLVMMADLLPPRHHSYDEVMTASIGIKDEVSGELKYQHKSSYEDLKKEEHKDQTNAGEIAQDALVKSGANTIETNNDLEDSIQQNIDTRKEKQNAINEFIEAAKNKTTEKIKTAFIALNS